MSYFENGVTQCRKGAPGREVHSLAVAQRAVPWEPASDRHQESSRRQAFLPKLSFASCPTTRSISEEVHLTGQRCCDFCGPSEVELSAQIQDRSPAMEGDEDGLWVCRSWLHRSPAR